MMKNSKTGHTSRFRTILGEITTDTHEPSPTMTQSHHKVITTPDTEPLTGLDEGPDTKVNDSTNCRGDEGSWVLILAQAWKKKTRVDSKILRISSTGR